MMRKFRWVERASGQPHREGPQRAWGGGLGLERPALQWLLVGVTILVGVLGLRTLIITRQLQERLQEVVSENENLQKNAEESNEQLMQERSGRKVATQLLTHERSAQAEREHAALKVVAFDLAMGPPPPGTRNRELKIAYGTDLVQFQLLLRGRVGFSEYRVGMRTAPGDEIWSQARLKPERSDRAQSITLLIPGSLLVPGDYELGLRGLSGRGRYDEVGYFYFAVPRK